MLAGHSAWPHFWFSSLSMTWAPSGDERWRDLLPLPLLAPEVSGQIGSSFESTCAKRNRVRRQSNLQKTNEVISALNSLAGFKHQDCGPATQNQQVAQRRLLRKVCDLPRSTERVFQREAIRELLLECPSSPYMTGEDVTGGVVAYDPTLASLPEVGAQPLDACTLLDKQGREILEMFEHTMLLDVEVSPPAKVKTYMDEKLRASPQAYADFVVELLERGMVDLVSQAASVITPFFVKKKNGKQRLVLDCRASNCLFHAPPDVALAAGYSFSQLELESGAELFVAQSDVKDYFYSIGLPEGLRRFFCLPAIDMAFLKDRAPDFEGFDGVVYPTMWIAQRIHQHHAELATGLLSTQVLVDGRPAPKLGRTPVLIPYADNLNVMGTCQREVQLAKDRVVARLRELGFRVHEEENATSRAQALGFVIDGKKGEIQPIAKRREKVRLTLLWLATRPRITGKAMERVIGHCVHLFMLRRELLSIFRSVYDFRTSCYRKGQKLWASAAEECRQAAALLLVCSADLRKPWSPVATVSDASLTGTAVAALESEAEIVRRIGQCRENWRFKSQDPLNRARDSTLKLDPFEDLGTVKPMDNKLDPFQLNLKFEHVPREFACSPLWKPQFACRMRLPEHITLLEGRGVVQAIRHKVRSAENFGMKHLHCGDNLGMTLAFDRGRAKSVPLLICCRRAAAFSIAADCTFTHRWLPSEWNAADAESRKWEPEGPKPQKEACKQLVDLLCYPNAVSNKLKDAGKQFLWGCAGQSEEAGPAAANQGGPNQEGSAAAAPSTGRIRESGQTSKDDGSETSPSTRRSSNHFGSGLCGRPNWGGVPAPHHAFSAVLRNTEVEAAKTSRSGLCAPPVPQPGFHGGVADQRRCQAFGSHHRPTAGIGGPAISQSQSACATGLEKHGSWCNASSSGMAADCSHCYEDSGGGTSSGMPSHSSHVRGLRKAGRNFLPAKERLDQEPKSRTDLGHQSPSIRQLGCFQSRCKQRDAAAQQPGSAVAGPSFAVHLPSSRRTIVPNQLRRSACHVAARPGGGRSVKVPCRAVSATPLGCELGQAQELPHGFGGEAAREMGVRSQPQEIRATCSRVPAVRSIASSREEESFSSANVAARAGPRTFGPQVSPSKPAFLELFAGCARLSQAIAQTGTPAEAWDIEFGPSCNLLNPRIQQDILKGISCRRFCAVHLGMPCTTWSRARRYDGRGPEPLRDDTDNLWGFANASPWDSKKIREGNAFLLFCIKVIHACNLAAIPWTLENPESSRVWLTKEIAALLQSGARRVETSFCMYDTPWRKATTFLAGNFPSLKLEVCKSSFKSCTRTSLRHVSLRGKNSQGQWLTRVAQPYPHGLCVAYASCLSLDLRIQ